MEQNEEFIEVEMDDENQDVQIQDTDIVFDCPHCGHNLCIDYRGAGLEIKCTECNEPVLVPIPDGMKISDLDLDSGELLKQLFATRRLLQRAEARAEALEIKVNNIANKVEELKEMLSVKL